MVIFFVLLFIVVLILAIIAGMNYVLKSKKPEDRRIEYVKSICVILEQCKLELSNDAIIDKIDKIINTLKYGNISFSKDADDTERIITEKTYELHSLVKGKKSTELSNCVDDLMKLVAERNILLK